MSKNKKGDRIGTPLFILICYIFLIFFCSNPAYAVNEESDVTPDIQPPLIYSEKEISSFDIEKLKNIATANSIEQKSPLALYCLAQKYKKSGNIKNAIESFKKLISDYPSHYLGPKACLELSSIYSSANNTTDEIDILNFLSSNYGLYSENILGLHKTALIMKQLKKIDEMHKKLEEAFSAFNGRPELIPLFFMSANEYLKNYNTKKALEKFEKLLGFKELTISQRAQALLGKAAAFEYNAEPEKALMIYDEILKIQKLDKNILSIADKSKANIGKAPGTPLMKINGEKNSNLILNNQGSSEIETRPGANRVIDSNSSIRPETNTTTEIKLRITD